MPDLRDVLRHGADVTAGLPDMPTVWTRAVRERRRRRAVAMAGVAAVVGAGALLGAVLDPGPPAPPQPVTTPRLPAAQELPPHPGPLEPAATYDVGELGLPYGFTVSGRGWTLAAREPRWVSLHHGDARVNLQQWDAVLDPTSDEFDGTASDRMPADLASWVASHPRLDVRARSAILLADHEWQVLEVSVKTPLESTPPECGSTPCVVLGQVGAEPVELLASERALLHVRSDDADHTVLLVALPDSTPDPAPAVSSLLDSFHERSLR